MFEELTKFLVLTGTGVGTDKFNNSTVQQFNNSINQLFSYSITQQFNNSTLTQLHRSFVDVFIKINYLCTPKL